VQHLIEIENPNHVVRKVKKVTEIDSAEASLSRREKYVHIVAKVFEYNIYQSINHHLFHTLGTCHAQT